MSKYWLSFLILLVCGSPCWAQITACKAAPKITVPTYTYTDSQTLVVTWTTSCGATSTVGFSGGPGDSGAFASSYKQYQDQTYPGVTSHSVTLSPATGFFVVPGANGILIVSCAWTTSNTVDMTKCANTYNQTVTAPHPPVVAGTLAYMAGSSDYVRLGPPKQDGVHPGYLATPGKDVEISVGFNETTAPGTGYQFTNGTNSTTFSGSLLSDFGINTGVWSQGSAQSAWTGGSPSCNNGGGNLYYSFGCGLAFNVPATVPTGANPSACTSHSGAVVLGTACVFPITLAFHVASCGTTYTCTDAPSQTVWIWVDSEAFPFNIGAAGVHRPPCLTDADIQTNPHKTNCTTDIGTSYWDYPHSWIGSAANWGNAFWNFLFKTDTGAQFSWFYDSCQMAVKLGQYLGQNDPWYGFNQTCMHDYRDHMTFPVVTEKALAFTFTQSAVSTLNPNLNNPSHTDLCGNAAPSGLAFSIRCSSMNVPAPATVDLTAMCTGFNTNHFTYYAMVNNSKTIGKSQPGEEGHVVACTPNGTTGGTVTVEAPMLNSAHNGWTVAPAGSVWYFYRELNNIPADGATDTTHIYCSTCDLSAMGTTDYVCYTGTIQGPNGINYGSQLWSVNPNPGSLVSAVNTTTNVITLSRAISGLAPGTPFQCRHWIPPANPASIYYWGEELYDTWQRYGDYASADIIPRYVQAAEYYAAPEGTNAIREQSLFFMDCRLNADLVAASVATAWSRPECSPGTSYFAVQLDHILGMTDTIARNSLNPPALNPPNCFTNAAMCDDKGLDVFLDGVRFKALIHCYNDVNCPGYQDKRIAWNVRQEVARYWNVWYSPNTGIPARYPAYCHQAPYIPQTAAIGAVSGGNYKSSKLGHYCAVYNDTQAMILGGAAWLYYLTGNEVIPGSNPPTTYSQAFDDFWQFEIPQAWHDWYAHPKQEGEQGGLAWESIETWFGNGTAVSSSSGPRRSVIRSPDSRETRPH